MALNQIPYTNVHELNLDWILQELKKFEAELSEFVDYGVRITELESKVNSINVSISSIRRTISEINSHCNNLEDAIEANDQKILDLRAFLISQVETLEKEIESLESLYYNLRAYNDTSNTVIFNRSKEYTDKKFKDFIQWVSDPELWMVISPITNRLETIQQVVDELYAITRWATLTAAQFDNLGFDCDHLDSIGFTCWDFDNYGRYALFFSTQYVTQADLIEYVKRSELDGYATKTDLEPFATKAEIKIYNPVTGIKGSIQQSVNTLVSFHQCGNNCYTLDGLEYTASQLDGLGISAYDFDFKGIIKMCGLYTDPTTGERENLQTILNNIVSLLTMGLTVDQYDALNLDADTFDTLDLDAYTLDYYGLSVMNNLGLITVLTGITAEQYQNIFVGNYGILHTIQKERLK